jgi:hypothetical protein
MVVRYTQGEVMMDEQSVRQWRIVAVVGAVALAAGVYFLWPASPPPPAPVATAAPPAPAQAPAPVEPAIEHPVEAVRPPEEKPAPVTLADSDPTIASALGRLIGDERVRGWLFGDGFVRRFVATVDNIPRQRIAMKIRSLQPVKGSFEVAHEGDVVTIAPGNAARYAPYVQMLERVDAKQLAGVYLRFYPLFQQAYEELGYPNAYFNDRLVTAIDHLLATPEVAGPLQLTQPRVLHEFADPQLEALSAGQKAMLRIGPDNARRVKAKLRALRGEITAKK